MADINLMLGELMNNPLFWVLIVILAFFGLGLHFGWFSKIKPKKQFKGEDLNESLKKDIEPRMNIQGKKVKKTKLMQGMIDFGKVRKVATGKIKFHARNTIVTSNPGKEESKLIEEELNVVYFTVGGNYWLNWIPYIGNKYMPEIFVINEGYTKLDPESKIYTIDKDVHIYPYARIWISDKKVQRYLTELEARRTQEFEAETNINTLKRWTYYHEPQSGRVVVMEKDADIEQDKWESAKDRGSEM